MTAIGIGLERHGRISQEDYGWGSVLLSGTAQPDLPLAEVYGPAVILTSHREVPLSKARMVLHATQPQTSAQLIRTTRCRYEQLCCSGALQPMSSEPITWTRDSI